MSIAWAYSDEYGQVYRVIETLTLWEQSTCGVWLPGCPGSQLSPEPSLTGTSAELPQTAQSESMCLSPHNAAACDSCGGRWP